MKLKDGADWHPTDEDIARWRELFPSVDVNRELAQAGHWLEVNPQRRKTRTGMKSYISRWMKRAETAGGSPFIPVEIPEGLRNEQIEEALSRTYRFYGRAISAEEISVWLRTFSREDATLVVKALEIYPQRGQYTPKPVDIRQIVDEIKPRTASVTDLPKVEPTRLGRLTAWYMRVFVLGSGKSELTEQERDDIDFLRQAWAKRGTQNHLLPEHREGLV